MKRMICALLCGALLLTLAGCGESEAEVMDPTVTVETTEAKLGALSSSSTYIGTVSAEGTASVVAMVSGTVESVPVAVGDTVTAGQLLCSFDDTSAQLNLESAQVSYQTALAGVESAQAGYQSAQAGVESAQAGAESAQAGYESAQAALNSAQQSYQGAVANYGGDETGSLTVLEGQVRMAQDNYDATKALFDIGAASQIEVDQAYQTLQAAQAGLQAAQANLGSAQAGVQQAQAGTQSAQAGLSTAQAGMQQAQAGMQQAQAGMQQAQAGVAAAEVGVAAAEYQLTLYNLTTPISGVVEAVNVTENNFAASGSVAFVISNNENKTVTFYVTDEVRGHLSQGQPVTVEGGGSSYTGVITEVSGVVDARTGLFQIKAIIDGAQNLPDGLTVELTTTSHAVEDAIVIPCDALYFDNGEAFVYVMRDGMAVCTDVELALYTPEEAAISSGLAPGDVVIASWSAALKDGAPVRLADEEAAPSGVPAE